MDVDDEKIEEMDSRIYAALHSLTEGDSFALVFGAQGLGFESWRRLHTRWGPLTAGRSRGLLHEILTLGRAK